jgi:hypothetical protein
MIYYKCDCHGEYCDHCTSIYKNLRIAKILNFMVLKDSIVAHHELRYKSYLRSMCVSLMFIRKEISCLCSKFMRCTPFLVEMR